MSELNLQRFMTHLTVTFYIIMALSGCSGSDSNNSSVPFSTLTSSSRDGIGSMARFSSPTGIATDGKNIYVADSANNTIRQIVIASGVVTTLAGTAGTKGSVDGVGVAAQFSSPHGIVTDGKNLYVVDTGNNTIRQIVIASGVVTTLAGTVGTSGTLDGSSMIARFSSPYGIATDGLNLYVTDTLNNTIRQVVIATGMVTTLAGTAGASGSTDGTGTSALFNTPYGVVTDGKNLYVADTGNNTIRQMVLASGVVTTLAGTAGTSGSTDGTGTSALFNVPLMPATDGKNLYFPDMKNNSIRKIEIATGVVTTLAGTAGTSGSTDGTGASALFNTPYGVVSDGINLYVADTGNNTIRQMVLASGVVTTLAGHSQK